MRPGRTYRNIRMQDVDFYVTRVSNGEIAGFWILRTTRNMMHKSPDVIPTSRFDFSDWEEVDGE